MPVSELELALTTPTSDINARMDYLERFLELARRGRGRGASGGERRAAKLARAVINEVPGLDGAAVAGLIEFVRLSSSKPCTARDLFEV